MMKHAKDPHEKLLVSRRGLLLGSATLLAGGAIVSLAPSLSLAAVDAGVEDRFMRLSNLLVNHQLDPMVGNRIVTHAAMQHENLAEIIDAIIAIADDKQATAVEDFFADIPDGHLKEFALWIVSAWYSGCSSSATDAEVFTYEQALTFKTTADVVTIPSFGLTGPNKWDVIPSASLADMPAF